MTFVDRYNQESSWHGRALIMEIFHLAACLNDKSWTLSKTANYFGVSIGLVSENLRLAQATHVNPALIKIQHRQEALRQIK